MPVELNRRGYDHARLLIEQGRAVLDDRDGWSDHRPSAQQENELIAGRGISEHGKWHGWYKHLAIEMAAAHLHGMLDELAHASHPDPPRPAQRSRGRAIAAIGVDPSPVPSMRRMATAIRCQLGRLGRAVIRHVAGAAIGLVGGSPPVTVDHPAGRTRDIIRLYRHAVALALAMRSGRSSIA